MEMDRDNVFQFFRVDELACNYNSGANTDDGTCNYGSTTFTKLDNTDIYLAENRDIIIEGGEITRGSSGPIYNFAQSSYAYNDGIAWKYGSIDSEYEWNQHLSVLLLWVVI